MRDQSHDFYIVSLNLIQREWDLNHTDRVRELLEGTRHSRYRGFEWGYYNRQAHREKATQALPHRGSQLTYTADGKRLLVSGGAKTYLWDIKQSAVVREFPGSGNPHARLSPDGKSVVTRDSTGFIRLWDTQTGALRLELETASLFKKNIGVNRFAFTPDISQLFVSYNNSFYLFDLATGKLIEELPELKGVPLIDLAADGSRLILVKNDGIMVYGLPILVGLRLLAKSSGASCILFSPDSSLILAGFPDGTVRLWYRYGEEISVEFDALKHQDGVWCLAFSPRWSVLRHGERGLDDPLIRNPYGEVTTRGHDGNKGRPA